MRSAHCSGGQDILGVFQADNDKVDEVPLFGSLVHPRVLVFACLSEYRAGDHQFMLCTFTQKEQSVAVHFAYTMFPDHSPPLPAVSANSGVESPSRMSLSVAGVEHRRVSRSA